MIQNCSRLQPRFWPCPMPARSVAFAFTLFFLGCTCYSELRAQSFLDKLEQAVRKQLSEAPPTSQGTEESSDELPAPKSATKPQNPSTTGAIPRLELAPSSSVPVVPEPTDEPANAYESSGGQALASGGQIYLGLEAEDPLGAGIGVRVSGVTEGSPAWKAGFRLGDRILAVNGFAIGKINDMAIQLGKTKPGDTVRFLVSRAGRNFPLTAVLMDANLAGRITGKDAADPRTPAPAYAAGPPYVGLTVNDLTSSFRNQFGISVFRGAAVSGVAKGSPADAVGIRAGDAVIELGGYAIESAKQLQDRVSQLKPGEKVELLYYRGSIARLVEIVVGNIPGAVPDLGRRSPPMRQANPAKLPEPPRPGFLDSSSTLPRTNAPTPRTAPKSGSLKSILAPGSLTPDAEPTPSLTRNRDSGPASSNLLRKLEEENRELNEQNDRLRAELAKVNDELKTTQAKLNQILELLKQR
jgi:hypothetical protein